jgi:hypothetical protein
MSKRLYPKPKARVQKRSKAPKENMLNRPFHVQYTDPNNELEPEWGHYSSELEVKVASWWRCRFLGFTPAATLYNRDEVYKAMEADGSGS